eukprot:48322-Eustigmatos_ZCMA.PRE.1
MSAIGIYSDISELAKSGRRAFLVIENRHGILTRLRIPLCRCQREGAQHTPHRRDQGKPRV